MRIRKPDSDGILRATISYVTLKQAYCSDKIIVDGRYFLIKLDDTTPPTIQIEYETSKPEISIKKVKSLGDSCYEFLRSDPDQTPQREEKTENVTITVKDIVKEEISKLCLGLRR